MRVSKGRHQFWNYWDMYGIFAILAVAAAVFVVLNPSIVSPANSVEILSRSAIVGISACGMTFAICAGGFDLSVGAILSLSTCVFATMVPRIGLLPATLLVLATGAACGVLNGLIITKLRIQTFVATLAMGMIIKGAALLYTQGKDAQLFNNIEAKVFSSGRILGMPVPIIMLIAVFVIAFLVYKYTPFGVQSRSIGSNEQASRASGIHVDRTLIIVFVLTGFTAAISGIMQSSQLLLGNARLGDGFELQAITATILGGTALLGGKGNLWGTLVAAVLLTLIKSGLNILGVSDEYQRLATGLILLLALSINGIRELTKEAQA